MNKCKTQFVTGLIPTLIALSLSSCSSYQTDPNYPIESGEIEASLVEELNEIANLSRHQTQNSANELSVNDSQSNDYLPELSFDKTRGMTDKRLEERFDVNVSNAQIGDVLMGLVNDTPYNVIVHPSVSGEISLSLKSVTIPEVMQVIRDVYGYEYKATASGFYVLPLQIQSRIFHMSYLNVERDGTSKTSINSGSLVDNSGESGSSISTTSKSNMWNDLKETIHSLIGDGEGRSVVVSPHSGMIVVKAMPNELRDVEDYIGNLQSNLNRQVIIEAKIVEISLNDRFQSGINWGLLNANSGETLQVGQVGGGTLTTGNQSLTDGIGSLLPGGALPSNMNYQPFGGVFSAAFQNADFSVFLELLKKQGDVQVLSSPHVSTINNQKAVIKVGRDEYFVTDVDYQSSSNSDGSESSGGPDIEFTPFFSGIALDVTPHVDRKSGITLHIHPSVSNVVDDTKNLTVAGQNQSIPLALSTVRESDSIIRVNSGELVVIGGLMETSTDDTQAGLPGLSSLPFIGEAFKQKRKVNQKTELVIMLRPVVIESPGDWSKAVDRYTQTIRGSSALN